MSMTKYASLTRSMLLAASILVAPGVAAAQEQIPDGKFITPLAVTGAVQQYLNPGLAAYPNFVAGQALRTELSPDGTTLAVLTAGQNSLDNAAGNLDSANSTQYIFLYNVAGAAKANPVLMQVIKQTNAHVGLVWAKDGSALYAAGGNDDCVYVYSMTGGVWAQSNKIALGHSSTHGNAGLGGFVQPNASGLAMSADGKTLVVANNYNDSISVIDVATGTVRYEHDLRPYFANNEGFSGAAGGEYPFAVVLKGNIAYVSSSRDREVVVVDVSSNTAGHLVTRIPLQGNALGMTLSKAGLLYVAQDNADKVAVINTNTSNTVVKYIDTRAPAGMLPGPHFTGAAPISVRIEPTGKYLYAVNAGANSIAVISLKTSSVIGMIPTAYEPTDVAFSADGSQLYITNGKSNTGPNATYLYGNTALVTYETLPGGNTAAAAAARATNNYQFQLEKASLVSAPVPAVGDLTALTAQVMTNNGYTALNNAADASTMGFLKNHINHVIYIVKENRTFDQILGDLGNGSNGDSALTMFGKAVTPNFHALATNFVTLDNFQDPGDGSMDGWSWAMQGRITNTEAITQQINYAFVSRGLSYESEGSNRNIPVGLDTAGRDVATGGAFTKVSAALPGGTANLLPGTNNHAAADSIVGPQQGYIWNAVLKAGKTVRNYGFMANAIGATKDGSGNPITNAGAAGVVQSAELNPYLVPLTDTYYRAYDNNVADLWRFNEWNREFQGFVTGGNLPNLSLVRFNHDHTGSFSTALAGVNTPETQQADDDLAVGMLVQAVANSPYANDTVIFITEDDCQDGPDHVDSHRASTYVAGAYVKKGAVVSTHYSQVNVLRTIEDIFGAPHINLNTAHQRPMADVFDPHAKNAAWTYTATASTLLKTTTLTIPTGVNYASGPDLLPAHDVAYWDSATLGFDFSEPDQAPTDLYNRVLWNGLMNGKAYPKINTQSAN